MREAATGLRWQRPVRVNAFRISLAAESEQSAAMSCALGAELLFCR